MYQKSRAFAQEIFELTRAFPKEEMFSLTDQVRHSSRSVGAQLAEAWAKRRYEKHFISKLTDADGDYITRPQAADLLAKYAEIGRLLGGMMAKAELFCNPEALSIHEEQAFYGAEH